MGPQKGSIHSSLDKLREGDADPRSARFPWSPFGPSLKYSTFSAVIIARSRHGIIRLAFTGPSLKAVTGSKLDFPHIPFGDSLEAATVPRPSRVMVDD